MNAILLGNRGNVFPTTLKLKKALKAPIVCETVMEVSARAQHIVDHLPDSIWVISTILKATN